MAETAHIGEMAEYLSDEVFAEFYWTKIGPTNQNWPCEQASHHDLKTHPSDVVFYYDEPYSSNRTYVNCDLKSYSKNSINPNSIKEAVESLAKQVACAEISETWRNLYADENTNWEVCGLLFVYNHDGGCDKDFDKLLNQIKNDHLDLPPRAKIVVFGPDDIFWLDNVRYEIRQMRGSSGQDKIPAHENCRFYYPQLMRRANLQPERARAATLEMLTSSWIILEHKDPKTEKVGYVVFYRPKGETQEEFIYLFEYLRQYQLLRVEFDIKIKILDASELASAVFQKAKIRYIEEMTQSEINTEMGDLINKIRLMKIGQVRTSFSQIELGMRYV